MKKIIAIIILLLIVFVYEIVLQDNKNQTNETNIWTENNTWVSANGNVVEGKTIENETKEINDWRLVLVNYENILPENFSVRLSNIDETRKFDSRAIKPLNNMITDMKKDGIKNVWVQSSYRSVEKQKEIFNNKVNSYIKQGKTKEEAERLTLETVNRPGTSDHNLGLAVDFNYVNYNFDETQAFEWLQENAENYGFILRYQKEKEEITKVNYEPWHWRYVGVEHAKKINELNMCLEEYIEYLKNS